jgi:hypothetical protein
MQNHHQNSNNNLNNPLQLESEQVVLKPLPVSTPAKFEKDKYSEARRARFSHSENVALYLCDLSGAEAYTYTLNGRFIIAAFTARSKKPVFHYAFLDETGRTERMQDFFSAQIRSEKRKIEARAERFNYEVKLKEGDILYTSWGWEQTNVDFYQVIRVIKKKIIVRKVAKDYTETQYMAGYSTPIYGFFVTGEIQVSTTGETSAKIEREYANLLTYQEINGQRYYDKKYESHYA